jgi:hypothetical protein
MTPCSSWKFNRLFGGVFIIHRIFGPRRDEVTGGRLREVWEQGVEENIRTEERLSDRR